jgi:hypothetical protein
MKIEKPVKKTEPEMEPETKLTDEERVPAYWHITVKEEPIITCRNIKTQRVFEGTREEFSALLRS